MKVTQQGNTVILEDVKNFNPKHIFECGQCFRWIKQEDDSYTGVAMGKVINVKQEGNKIYLDNTTKEDFDNIWYDYFDLGRDYESMVNTLKVMDEHLEKATEFGEGIRILKQDGWEMLISFIISANNRIPMIQRAINNLSKNFGTYIGEYKNQEYYAFPTPQQLNKATIEEIRACSTGFRDKYIKSTAQIVNDEKIEEYQTYYDIVNKTQKFKESSENFNIALEMTQIPDGTYRYAIVVDEAKIAMYDVVMIAVENNTPYDDADKMMPSLGIFEDSCSLIPGQVNTSQGYAKGLAMSGEYSEDGVDLEILVQYKNAKRTKETREFFSYHLNTEGYEYKKVEKE